MDGVERKMVDTKRKMSSLDPILRVLALILTLAAAIVLGTSKQTKVVPIKIIATLPPVNVAVPARWHYLSAFVYHVVTNATACAYAAVSVLLVLANKGGKSGVVMMIILVDLAMVALLFSSIGAAGAVGLLGYKGNSHVQWKEVCSVFGKFCDRAAVSLALSLLGAGAFFLLVASSAFRLLRKHN